jgi:putative thioredoxin
MTDVTDASFEQEVLDRSEKVPVVVDLWAPWCGPCRTLGPIIERVVEETGGAVELAKVNVDESPQVSAAFQVQSIPAVYAVRDRKVVDGFIGALPESQVRAFVDRLAPARSEADELVAAGDEASLRRALELQPDHVGAIVALAELVLERDGDAEQALALVQRVPETAETRRVAALARLAAAGHGAAPERHDGGAASPTARLDELLGRVKQDEQARREFLDLLETMDPDDPERARYRRALSARLF